MQQQQPQKLSQKITSPRSLRLFKRHDTADTRTETNSSLDSASVRDENLDAFLQEGQHSFSSIVDDNSFGNWSNADLLQALEDAVEYEKHVLVARYLQEMDKRGLQLQDPKRQAVLKRNAEQVQEVIDSHSQDPEEGGWKKQGLVHGRARNTMVYHRTNEKGEVTVRCETPIQASLVAPLLAILNETDLYTTWCPSFQRPFKLGVTDTGKHKQCSRACQVAYAKVDMPWPMANREVIAKNVMADALDEVGAVVIRAKTMEAGEEEDGLVIPPVAPGWDRIKMDAGLLLRKCPQDHPALKKKKQKKTTQQNEEKEEPMLLATFTLFVTPSVNTVLKIIAGPMWMALVGFAEDMHNGKKGEFHRERMEQKPELYGWADEIVQKMAKAVSS